MDTSTEQQPMLQLALDVVQHENYATSIAAHASTAPGSGDGAFRLGMFQEPVFNTNGELLC